MLGRRDFLRALSASITLVLPSTASHAQVGSAQREPYVLDMQRGSHRYQLDITTPHGYNAAAWLLRDVQADFVGLPNIDTLRLLAWAQAYIAAHGRHTVFIATSGARLLSTNSHIEGAAQNSLHIPDIRREFTAVDLSPDNLDLTILGEVMKLPRFGGVGLYKTHVHVDRGRYATWQRG
ncbi:MAG: hypothetical protein JNM52_03275 [Betaproteobacteria bacterium]|nr:hypothetical protein [Betaproteobacteria bacterium]